jgi:hypothetical protein
VPSKHGLRKVYKSEFDRDPERYVLRQGFPDFPACPFGGAFSILGFDTAEQVICLARHKHHPRFSAD